ncbi:VWA domain-containing protein [Streptomyces sp. CAU 1734]|uniref:VWA domain-containing protein n=1 Tax=Streptomyces sp. CAU 1734 TaxID=3140360 RepID=UPI003260841D
MSHPPFAGPPAGFSAPPAAISFTGQGPAISLRKVEERAPALVNLYKSAGVSLRKHNMEGGRAAVYLVIDYSGSMREYYKDGSVQALADRVLGLSAHLDDDGVVPVVFFSTDVDAVTDIALENHRGRVAAIAAGLGHMGKTSYHLAMDAVIDLHLEHCARRGAAVPALVVFQTDGGPINKLAAERYLCKSARLPLFWQFIGFGDRGSRQFDFLRKLDELAVPDKRPIDNAGFFHAGLDPRRVPDADLYDRLVGEFPRWLAAARAQRIVH